MAKVTTSASRTVYIRSESPYQGSMSVWALRDFLKAVDELGVPDNAALTCHKAHDTQHFIGISVRVTTDINEEERNVG